MKLYFLGLLYPQLMHFFGTAKIGNWKLKVDLDLYGRITPLTCLLSSSFFCIYHVSFIFHKSYSLRWWHLTCVYRRLWCLNSGMLKSTMYWPLPWMEEWRFASSPWNVQASEIPNISKIQIWSRLFSRLQLIIKYFVLLFWKRKWTLVI